MTGERRDLARPLTDARIDGPWRYMLRRRWADGGEVCWIMLNPSTADALHDDPTIRRCVGFSKAWGFGGLVVVNLFALRATDPTRLRPVFYYQGEYMETVGPDNDAWIDRETGTAALIVAAWGNNGTIWNRGDEVRETIGADRLHHLGLTKAGQPRHPLYVRSATAPIPWAVA
jgi:hypothetical protein